MAIGDLARELRDLVAATNAPPDELAMLIGQTFRHGRMLPGSREVLYGQSDEVALRLVYAKSGRFTVVTEEALTDEDARALIRQIEALEHGGDPVVWRTVLFAALPVNGFFRYDDRWQVRPVPPEAPRPPFVMAPHPFILEVKGRAVSEPLVGWLTGGKLLWEVQLVLALVLHAGITAGGTSAHHEWVIETPDLLRDGEPHSPRSVLGQVGYALPTWPGPPDDFSDVEGIEPIREVASAEYMSRRGIGVEDCLEIPDLLVPLLSSLDAVPSFVRERFFRSAYWFSRSQPAWRISQSLSYISLINAIEVLAPAARKDPCPTCGLNRAEGPTARFREIVERYAGELPERKQLYDLRSRLVHGDQILLGDRPLGWGFTPQSQEERSRHELASSVARVVIIAWLLEAAEDDQPE